jgi:hypothetical protein
MDAFSVWTQIGGSTSSTMKARTSNLDYVENLVTLLCDVASIKRSTEGGTNQAFWKAERATLFSSGVISSAELRNTWSG